jgi:hypothetical protein
MAYKLNRDDCGLVVHVTNGDWTIVGILERVDVTLIAEYPEGWGPTEILRSGGVSEAPCHASGRLWLRVGPWEGDIPLSAVATVEIQEKALPGPDVIQGELVAGT